MAYVWTFLAGAAAGGSAIGFVAYTYGKKIGAAVAAVGAAAQAVKKA